MSASLKKTSLTATSMRTALFATLTLLLLGIGIGFYFILSYLQGVAKETISIEAESLASETKTQELMRTQSQLEDHAVAVKRAGQIVAESTSYQYQDQIIKDLSAYAAKTGLTVSSFSFADNASPGQPTSSQGSGGAGNNGGNSSAKINSVMVSIELRGNITYKSLLQFVHLIEQNLTRMQVSGLSLSAGGNDEVKSQSLQVEVYVK